MVVKKTCILCVFKASALFAVKEYSAICEEKSKRKDKNRQKQKRM